MDRALSEEQKKQAFHLGDGLYCIDHGFQLELFASNGLTKSDSVFLDDQVQVSLVNYLQTSRP